VDQVEEVKSKVDIVEVISSYIPLKRAGRNFAGLCPFHGERTPSFMVSAERQAFKCFGCGEGGDVFTFVEKMEGWDFRETLEEMAKRAGVTLKSFAPSTSSKEKEKLIEIHKLSEKLYSHILGKHKLGEAGRKYLLARGIAQTSWEKFGLGFAPDAWTNLVDFLTKRNFSLADIAKSGLIIARKHDPSSYYDRFRGRIIFPIRDIQGKTLGFSGRVIEGNEKEAKYINSPETLIFDKGSMLFGIDVARQAIKEKNEAIIVEGEFDAISANQAGVENIVASKGTAFSDRQVSLISRISQTVILGFDTDLAGDAAARRGIELLDIAGVNIRIAELGKYHDPDEFVRGDLSGFKKAIGESENVYDFLIESSAKRNDRKTVEGKKKIGAEVIPAIAKISDDIVRAHYIEKLSKVLDLDIGLVAAAVEKKVLPTYAVSGESAGKAKSAISLDEYFLALIFAFEELESWMLSLIKPDEMESKEVGRLWKFLSDIMGRSKSRKLKLILADLPKDLKDLVDHLYLVYVNPRFSDRELLASELETISKRIRRNNLKRELFQISEDLKRYHKKGDTMQVESLNKKFNIISKSLKEVEGGKNY